MLPLQEIDCLEDGKTWVSSMESSLNKSKIETMVKTKIVFWATTGLLFLTQALMPILTTNADETKEAMSHLGYPIYFVLMLAIFKLLGGLVLIIPQIPPRIKEWAYAGFAIDFIAAFVSIITIDGFGSIMLFPLVALAILITSYGSYYKITKIKTRL